MQQPDARKQKFALTHYNTRGLEGLEQLQEVAMVVYRRVSAPRTGDSTRRTQGDPLRAERRTPQLHAVTLQHNCKHASSRTRLPEQSWGWNLPAG